MKKIDKIISVFTKTIKDLEKLIEDNDKKCNLNFDKIEDLTHHNNLMNDENKKAFNIKNKLSDLME